MKYRRSPKILSVFMLLSLSLVAVSHAFMKLETKQIFSVQDQTIETVSTMDMSGMFDQFESLGMSDLSAEEKAQLEASFDGICDQMKNQITQSNEVLAQLGSTEKDPLTALQESFTCKKLGFGKFEIRMILPLEKTAYTIENNQFILEYRENTLTPEMKQQLDMFTSQDLPAGQISAEQIEQMRAMGMEIKLVFVFPGKVVESNVGKIAGNTVTIDLWEEVITMMEQGSLRDFFERLSQMRIVSDLADSATGTTPPETIVTTLVAPTTETEMFTTLFAPMGDAEVSDQEILLEMLLEDETFLDELSDEDILALLTWSDTTPSVLIPPMIPQRVMAKPEPVAEPVFVTPAFVRTLDKQALEEEVIQNIFRPDVFSVEKNPPSPKTTYSPDRMLKNIQTANAARQAKKANSTSRYADFFRNAAK